MTKELKLECNCEENKSYFLKGDYSIKIDIY